MGKKSKRSRGKAKDAGPDHGTSPRTAPSLRQEEKQEETLNNLQFEDPFPDNYEEEVVEEQDDEEEKDMQMQDTGGLQSWNPLTGNPLEPGQKLEMDESAYKMYHALTPEWPSLSFDFIRDHEGDSRTRFPHSLICVAGTQADRPERNSLTVMKLSDLGRTKTETEDDILGEEYNPNRQDDSDDDDDDSVEDVDLDPILEHMNFRHYGGVNRVRVWPQQPEIVATWSDAGRVHLYDVSSVLETFSNSQKPKKASREPFFVYNDHGVEGYAMDWSNVKSGQLATGDCHGHIHLWTPSNSDWNTSSFAVSPTYEPQAGDNLENASVEDLQWSPTEGTVLASAECGGYVRIYDTRAPHRAMLGHKIHSNSADVNVLSWNKLVANLIATGGDDGVLSVWDLRTFSSSSSGETPSPLARFTSHQTPITSLEWHPSDESMLAVSDDVGTYIYDLSIEEEDDEVGKQQQDEVDVPPQLLFVHCGSEQFKEVHWHPQITSCLMTTALSGFNAFIPSNL